MGRRADISGTGTDTRPTLSIFVPAFGPELRVASAAKSESLSWFVLAMTEKSPSSAEPLIGVVPMYFQVRFRIDGLSTGRTNDGLVPTKADENAQPLGWRLDPETKLPKS